MLCGTQHTSKGKQGRETRGLSKYRHSFKRAFAVHIIMAGESHQNQDPGAENAVGGGEELQVQLESMRAELGQVRVPCSSSQTQ